MCLILTRTQNRPRRRYVWKVVDVGCSAIASPVFGQTWTLGREHTSSRRARSLTRQERKSRDVETGFHVYTSLTTAKEWALYADHAVMRCCVNPADWIADGYGSQAVYRKLTPVAIIKR